MLFRLLFALLVGAIAGWIATTLVARSNLGLGVNIVVGMVGAALARFLLPSLGLGSGLVAAVIHATIGAVILLLGLRLVKRL